MKKYLLLLLMLLALFTTYCSNTDPNKGGENLEAYNHTVDVVVTERDKIYDVTYEAYADNCPEALSMTVQSAREDFPNFVNINVKGCTTERCQ